MLNFVGNQHCSGALGWSAEAACRTEAGFRFRSLSYSITSVLPVITVIMALLLQWSVAHRSQHPPAQCCSCLRSPCTPQQRQPRLVQWPSWQHLDPPAGLGSAHAAMGPLKTQKHWRVLKQRYQIFNFCTDNYSGFALQKGHTHVKSVDLHFRTRQPFFHFLESR